MNDVLATTLTFVALGAALWALVLVIAGQPVRPDRWHGLGALAVVALLELGLLAQAVAGIVAMVTTERELDGLSFVGYLVGPVLIVPLAAFWGLVERTRWGPGVLVIGCLTVPVMILRLGQVWNAHG
ncbi:hypothetical protein [Actinophytocola gossypii]|uniref:Integral membrane protein n=1 Tax=Actinophytocola gossypii TaxID=2812003 RepID=A0ABT2JJ20_9PSEU|nr:hypothetical protein [Actinophytocola gossypii]MCT2587878.1 hypothetical protein [Actinophytocola gossypii]